MHVTKSRLTPLDVNYSSCERTYAELRIYPGETSPNEVTQRLGIKPTKTINKGETRTNRIGRVRYIKKNGWFLSSEEKISSLDLRHHLDWLLSKLETGCTGIKELQWQKDVVMTVACIWWSAKGHGGPTLWPEQMQRLADLNLECAFDIAFFGDEEE